jgi:hypothetical protein
MALPGGEYGLLVFFGQSTQGVGQGGADVAVSEFGLSHGRQVGPDIDSASHPAGPVLKQAGDALEGETFLVDQGTDDPRLVECGDGSRRRIGQKQQAFVLLSAAGTLEDYWNLAVS